MCKASIENSLDSPAQADALNLAIIALLLPPLTLMSAIIWLAYKRNNVAGLESKNSEGITPLAKASKI